MFGKKLISKQRGVCNIRAGFNSEIIGMKKFQVCPMPAQFPLMQVSLDIFHFHFSYMRLHEGKNIIQTYMCCLQIAGFLQITLFPY